VMQGNLFDFHVSPPAKVNITAFLLPGSFPIAP
jgi:hypothetical protein